GRQRRLRPSQPSLGQTMSEWRASAHGRPWTGRASSVTTAWKVGCRMSDCADPIKLDGVPAPLATAASAQGRFLFAERESSPGMTRPPREQPARYSIAHADAVVWLKSLETA